MLQRIYFFPHCSKPSLQIFCNNTIIKSQQKYQGGKIYSVSTPITAAKAINENIQHCDMAQACTVWDRAFNVCKTFQNVPPPPLMHVVHVLWVEKPSTHQLTVLCKHCSHNSSCNKCFQTVYHTTHTCPHNHDVFHPPTHFTYIFQAFGTTKLHSKPWL
jgi:hypothetical protein